MGDSVRLAAAVVAPIGFLLPPELCPARCVVPDARVVRQEIELGRGARIRHPSAVTPERPSAALPVDQLVDMVAQAAAKVLDVERSHYRRSTIVSTPVKVEVGRLQILPRNDVVLAGFNGVAAARTLVDDADASGIVTTLYLTA